jgi:hypothetical protein
MKTNISTKVCYELDKDNKFYLKETTFTGVAVGNEMIRNCPSFNCEIIKYGAFIPEFKILEKQGDWYRIVHIEKVDYLNSSTNNEGLDTLPKEGYWIHEKKFLSSKLAI